MKKLIAIFILAFATVAGASTAIDTSKLSKAQHAELAAKVEEMRADNPSNMSATIRKEAEAWGDMGANMGKAIVGAAKEVGVAANEFAETPLGRVTVAITAYKIIGKEMLGVIVGSIILVFGYSLAIWILTTHRWSNVKYEYVPTLWGMYNRQRIVSIDPSAETVTGKIMLGAGLLIVTSMVALSTIF